MYFSLIEQNEAAYPELVQFEKMKADVLLEKPG